MRSGKQVLAVFMSLRAYEHYLRDGRYSASVIMSITYGKTTPTSYSDPEVKQINLGLKRLGNAVRPGAYLVDSYPFLKYIPFFTSELRRFHREELALYRSQLQGVKTRLVSIILCA